MNQFEAQASTRKLQSEQTIIMGKLLWLLLRATSRMGALTFRRTPVTSGSFSAQRSEITTFGEEVGRDEIDWWINRKEDDLPVFTERVQLALQTAQTLKAAASVLKKLDVESYDETVAAFSPLLGATC